MRIRTYVGLLLSLGAVVAASYLTHQNRDLLHEPFRLAANTTVPLYAVLLAILLAGFLPTVTLLLVQGLRRDLAQRDERRRGREEESLGKSFRRAVDYEADGQWARAAAELEVVLAARPDDFSALLRYGAVLRRLGRSAEAQEVHRRAAVQFPRSVALLYQLAEDYEARGDGEVAVEIENRILRDYPGMGLAVLRRRRNRALSGGKFGLAAELQAKIGPLLAEAGASAEGEEAGVRLGLEYQRGVELLEAERADEAAALFRGILAQEERFLPAVIMLGEAELLREDEEAALAEWLRGYETSGSPIFLQRIEDHFIEREEPRRAIETLRRLIATAASDLLPRFYLGRLYYRLEMHEEALKVLAGLGERIGSSPTYHFLVGRIRERRGEMRLALAAYAECARQLGVPQAEYRCRVCATSYPEWHDRCGFCGAWNAVELDFEEEKVSPEALGVRPAPVWGPPAAAGVDEGEGA